MKKKKVKADLYKIMKTTILLIGLVVLTGCDIYYPAEISVSAPDHVDVNISKNNTKIDITIKEEPRELIVYSLAGSQKIRLRCFDEFNNEGYDIEHSILWADEPEVFSNYNKVYYYERLEVDSLIEKIQINTSEELNCYIPTDIRLNRVHYVDGIKVTNETDLVFFDDVFGTESFELSCWEYNERISDRCSFHSEPGNLQDFLQRPTRGGYDIMQVVRGLR